MRLVLNQLETDEEAMTGLEFARRELSTFRDYLARKWILILMALAAGAATYYLGRPLLNAAAWPGAGLRRLSGR